MSSSLFQAYKGFVEPFVPLLKESQFIEKGVLTPEEFVKAGDELVSKCGTWQWSSHTGNPAHTFLPSDKQFLTTRNVPCLKRALAYQLYDAQEELVEEGNWVTTHVGFEKEKEQITDLDMEMKIESVTQNQDKSGSAPDLFEFDAEEDEQDEMFHDDFVVTDAVNENVVRTRTYDLSITYDRYYQTPRLWLFGYDEDRQPLSTLEIMEDMSNEHANKTVTIDPHPHLKFQCASIHPCKHASVMQKLMGNIANRGKQPRVENYLFYFLKFISSVIPTIEYDYTLDVQ